MVSRSPQGAAGSSGCCGLKASCGAQQAAGDAQGRTQHEGRCRNASGKACMYLAQGVRDDRMRIPSLHRSCVCSAQQMFLQEMVR